MGQEAPGVENIVLFPLLTLAFACRYFYYLRPIMTLFVAGLPYDIDNAELEEIFEKFGKVRSAKVTLDRETGKSRGFGFVEMENDEDALQAIELLNEISLDRKGKPLVVKQAEDRPSSGGRSGGGGGRPGNRPNNKFNRW